MWGNLQAITENGEIFKNYQTKNGLLESKLSKNILGDCTFINSMQKIPLILNLCQTIQNATLVCVRGGASLKIGRQASKVDRGVGVKLLCPCIIYWYSKTRVVEIWSIFFLSQPSINKNTFKEY